MSSLTETTHVHTALRQPRRAKDAVKGTKRKPPEALFDAFWREGELAMLFGEPGSGKSVLAVQIADSLARGTNPMQSAQCKVHNVNRRKRQKVLYIDLVLSEKQFGERYSEYDFAPNLIRETPPEGEGLFGFVAAMVTRYGYKSVIIDDLSLVSRTADGTHEALALMHHLRSLTVETGVSVLVLADTYPFVYENHSPERGLRRSRVLCDVADSVFALYEGKVVQTRSRSGEKVWTQHNQLRYRIEELDNGMLGMILEPPEVDLSQREQIAGIKRMHDHGKMTFRQIAAEIGISKSQAQRLFTQWTPEIEEAVMKKSKENAERKAHNADLDAWRASGGLIKYDYTKKQWTKAPKDSEIAESQA